MKHYVRFKKWNCELLFSRYASNSATAILLIDRDNGSKVAAATVNIDKQLPANHVAIKSWSENEGMLEALTNEGIVKPTPTGDKIPCGYAEAHICELLINPNKD